MKVLIVSAFPPDPAPEANHALHISERLARSGLSVHVLSKKGSIAGTQPDIVVHPVINDWAWSDLPALVKCIKECRPDVVLLLYIGWIFNHQRMITFLPTICKTVLPDVACVTQFENVDEGLRPRSFLARALRKAAVLWTGVNGFSRRSFLARSLQTTLGLGPGGIDVHRVFGTLLRESARVVFLSSPQRAKLAAHYPDIEGRSFTVPPPPLIRFCPDEPTTARKLAREALGAAENDFVLIYWGYIYPGKGVETLLQAFRIVYSQKPNVRLGVVGGSLEFPTAPISCGDYFKMVRGLPEKLGVVERVTWTGPFAWDSDTGSRYLYAGDLCVLPFDYGVTLNNSSLAAASTHGLPVIATELPAGRDEALEHGRNIYLCPPGEPAILAEAIRVIIDSAELRERLRVGIRRLARDWYHWQTTTDRLVGILKAAVSDRELREPDPANQEDNGRWSSPLWSSEHRENDSVREDGRILVSIIVAAYNVGKYLPQCLDSLVNQTLKSVEIIVVDDASEDHSLELLEDYKARYPHLIRIIRCESNQGLGSVRNAGMKVARGQYVGFTDGDDWADIRMCEVMYQRARSDNSDVVIADCRVFFEDSKTWGFFFDRHIRRALDPGLRTRPFDVSTDSRVLLLEPVAWTKLYKRSFLEAHGITFEDGMNSYEDICFHFAAMLKATRISLLDNVLFCYRQNRPGQISGRRSRKVFEVFAVFDKIQKNLAAWDVPIDIWAVLVRVMVRQFDWLLRDRVQAGYKREFLALVAKQLQAIPETGFRHFARGAHAGQVAKLFCMRRNRFRAYEEMARVHRCLETPYRLYKTAEIRLKCQRFLSVLCWGADFLVQRVREGPSESGEPRVKVCWIDDQTLRLAHPPKAGLADGVWRMAHDYYLVRAAMFRPGDTVVDVGAHVGIVSLYLAKQYPFIKVYAIEPDPANHDCLKRNVELNGVTNVTVINKAVSGDGQKRTLYSSRWHSTWATIDARAAASRRFLRSVQVDTVTLEQLFQENDIRHCRLLKMTAPGAIHESLKGFRRAGCVDLLCGEVEAEDCSRAELEAVSWKIARQHFWRTGAWKAGGTVAPWLYQRPLEIERSPANESVHR